MNIQTATLRTATPTVNPQVNSQALRQLDATPRYRNRDFGVGYGRSEGYARSHGLWRAASRRYA